MFLGAVESGLWEEGGEFYFLILDSVLRFGGWGWDWDWGPSGRFEWWVLGWCEDGGFGFLDGEGKPRVAFLFRMLGVGKFLMKDTL